MNAGIQDASVTSVPPTLCSSSFFLDMNLESNGLCSRQSEVLIMWRSLESQAPHFKHQTKGGVLSAPQSSFYDLAFQSLDSFFLSSNFPQVVGPIECLVLTYHKIIVIDWSWSILPLKLMQDKQEKYTQGDLERYKD